MIAIAFFALAAGAVLLIAGVKNASVAEAAQGKAKQAQHGSPTLDSLLSSLGGSAPASAASSSGGAPSIPAAGSRPMGANKAKFAELLAQHTGMSTRVIRAWLNHEQGATSVEGGNNWLNVETGGPGGGTGPYGATAKYVERLSLDAAALFTAQWLAHNQPSILESRGHGEAAEAQAIINSGWAESHYGYESPAAFLSAA